MGSVKNLIGPDDPVYGKWNEKPKLDEFGMGPWRVGGTFSVKDLKKLIPPVEITHKAEALTMMTAAFFEWLKGECPDIPMCYESLLDRDGNRASVQGLLEKGDTTNIILMKLAHVPETFAPDFKSRDAQLARYRRMLGNGTLQCGVADIESIFRAGFPLGSSTFKKIAKAAGFLGEYEKVATYDATVAVLDKVRAKVGEQGLDSMPELRKVLADAGLGTTVPNPGFVLDDIVYNTTTKFEGTGDRDIGEEEARRFSGLDEEGYRQWTQDYFPRTARAQRKFAAERGIENMDGKEECVAYRRRPVLTDFALTPDENREMISVKVEGTEWLIPTNKEIQRAVFTEAGVDVAKREAIEMAGNKGGDWMDYMPERCSAHGIDLRAVSEHSCSLMSSAIAEVANRTFGKRVFDAKPVEAWVRDFVPYASKLYRKVA